MKRFAVALAVIVICLFGSNEVGLSQHKHHDMKSMSKADSSHEQSNNKDNAVVKTKADTTKPAPLVNAKVAASIKEIVRYYLQLKNALVYDKTNESATAGSALETAFKKLDTTELTSQQKKVYKDVEDDAREHAEHIGVNAGNIEHQREHFDMLSKDIYDLVKTVGSPQLLYKDFCPMYNDKKGAIWLSEKKEIANPYYGKKMSTCGSVKEEIR